MAKPLSVCIGGLAVTVLALGLGYGGTAMGGGDVKDGIVLSMVLGPLDASLTRAPAGNRMHQRGLWDHCEDDRIRQRFHSVSDHDWRRLL